MPPGRVPEPPDRRTYVAVAGPHRAAEEIRALAYEVGLALARAGAVVVCGGGGGAMEAACRGATDAGGTTLGILPGRDRSGANAFVDLSVVTGMGEGRNALIALSADALVAVGGGYGTLSEIALALRMGKPVAVVGSWSLAVEEAPELLRAASPDEAVRMVLSALRSGGGGQQAPG